MGYSSRQSAEAIESRQMRNAPRAPALVVAELPSGVHYQCALLEMDARGEYREAPGLARVVVSKQRGCSVAVGDVVVLAQVGCG